MRKIFRIEIKRAFRSPLFWIALSLGLAIVILQYFQFVVPCVKYLDEYKTPKGIGLYPHSVFNKWIGGDPGCYQSYLFFLILPILATMPFGTSFYTDQQNGYIKNVFIRTKKSYYYVSNYIVTFLTGGLVIIIPLIVNILLTATTLPALMPQSCSGTFSVMPTAMWSNLFYTHPWVYIMLFIVVIFLFSGFLATLAPCISYYVQNRFVVLIAPFILYLFVYAVTNLLSFDKLNPMSMINPGLALSSTGCLILYLVVMGVSSILLMIGKGIHDDTF